jgi:hypothetical protein
MLKVKRPLLTCFMLGFLPDLFFDPEDRGRLTFNGLHSVTSQKTGLFLTTAVRTSDPTQCNVLDAAFRRILSHIAVPKSICIIISTNLETWRISRTGRRWVRY